MRRSSPEKFWDAFIGTWKFGQYRDSFHIPQYALLVAAICQVELLPVATSAAQAAASAEPGTEVSLQQASIGEQEETRFAEAQHGVLGLWMASVS